MDIEDIVSSLDAINLRVRDLNSSTFHAQRSLDRIAETLEALLLTSNHDAYEALRSRRDSVGHSVPDTYLLDAVKSMSELKEKWDEIQASSDLSKGTEPNDE